MPDHFEYIVIGGGSAGYAAAKTLREEQDSVAIVDDSKDLGGLCIRRGCMPSKTVIYSAEVLHHARHAEKFGLEIPSARVDMLQLRQRKRAMVEEFAEGRVEALHSDRFTLFRNRARFVDEQTLELDDGTRLTAGKFFIATGSAVNWPEIPGLDRNQALTSDDILELDTLPESMIVLGGGVVACELAQYLNRLGVKITQVQRSEHVLKEFNTQASEVVEQAFRDEGIHLYTGTQLKQVEKCSAGIFRATFLQAGETVVVEADQLFNALGRKPNTEGLNLEAAGIATGPRGHIVCDGYMVTSNPRVYAAGDVSGPEEIVHVAIKQGEVAARHALGHSVKSMNYDTPLGVIFTDPQVAFCGLSEGMLRELGIEYHAASYPFDDHGKSILMEAKYGFVKVMADAKSGRILGAECIGKDGGELIHALNVAVGLKATAFDLLEIDWYHPTLSEIWEYPLEDIAERIQEAVEKPAGDFE